MMNILIFMIFILMLSSTLLIFNFLLNKKKIKNREKNSPFECGFDPMENSRIPMSIQFFLISLIFLIFDIEITLLIPLIFNLIKFNKYMINTFFFFMIILLLGIYIEYLEQSMDWKN